ncbi:hypothetical protein [Jongsikchunia kroppenstedtii]|uniref:hypothetical protein n=1 Tax=Jongsikchunia kroppenstedtii TaxID=1121721 RepID=UPI000371780C|nr:hypothetical protein [Jongsikchunia kroppenstedtii]
MQFIFVPGILVFAVLSIVGTAVALRLCSMIITGDPLRQTVSIAWHSDVLQHAQACWSDGPHSTLLCSCGRTWDMAGR